MEHTIFEPNPAEAQGTRDTKAHRHTSPLQKNCSARKAATIHPSVAGCHSPKMRQPNIFENLTLMKQEHDPAAFKHHPRTRTKAPPQRRLLTSVLCPKTAMYRKNRTKHVRALTTQRSHVQGRFSMAICIRCRQPNTWLELKLINFGDGNNYVEWQGARREIGGGGVSGFGEVGGSGESGEGPERSGASGQRGKERTRTKKNKDKT